MRPSVRSLVRLPSSRATGPLTRRLARRRSAPMCPFSGKAVSRRAISRRLPMHLAKRVVHLLSTAGRGSVSNRPKLSRPRARISCLDLATAFHNTLRNPPSATLSFRCSNRNPLVWPPPHLQRRRGAVARPGDRAQYDDVQRARRNAQSTGRCAASRATLLPAGLGRSEGEGEPARARGRSAIRIGRSRRFDELGSGLWRTRTARKRSRASTRHGGIRLPKHLPRARHGAVRRPSIRRRRLH